jgi:hypothetical protein
LKKILAGFVVLGVLLLAVWLFQRFFPNDETRIHKLLDELAATASFSANEPALQRLANAQKLGAFFTADPSINLEVTDWESRTLQSRDELVQLALAVRSTVSGVQIELPDVIIAVSDDHESASAHLTAKASVAGKQEIHVQEFRLQLKKIDGDWKIWQVDTVRTLTR